MFTGLIREIATVKSYRNNILSIRSSYRPKLGDSIAVNGVCLTVIRLNSDGFDLELADETRAIIDESKIRGEVHIEPAMMMNDRFYLITYHFILFNNFIFRKGITLIFFNIYSKIF